jgi:hypothetical protein
MDRGFGRALRDLTALQEMREEGTLLRNRRGGTTSKRVQANVRQPGVQHSPHLYESLPHRPGSNNSLSRHPTQEVEPP